MDDKGIYARAAEKMREKGYLFKGRPFEKREFCEELGCWSPRYKNGVDVHKPYRDAVGQVLYNWTHEMVKPLLVQDGKHYRFINREFKTVKPGQYTNPRFDLVWPKGIDESHFSFADTAVVTKGDVMGMGGEGNRGKSTFALGLAVENMNKFNVTLVLSENAQKFEGRAANIGWADIYTNGDKSDWRFEVLAGRGQEEFIDIARERKDNLIIYDWLSVTKDAYKVSDFYEALQECGGDGVKFVIQQKRSYHEYVVGGEAALDFCSVFFYLKKDIIEVVKVKTYDANDPNDVLYRFKTAGAGTAFSGIHEIEKCHSCRGTKYVKKELCYSCQGTGYTDVIGDY